MKEIIIALIFITGLVFITVKVIKLILAILKFLISPFRLNKREVDLTKSNDWLVRAQAKQEIRFQNSLPPLLQEAEPQKLTIKEKNRVKKGKSPTGWTFNEKTKLWEPPKK